MPVPWRSIATSVPFWALLVANGMLTDSNALNNLMFHEIDGLQ